MRGWIRKVYSTRSGASIESGLEEGRAMKAPHMTPAEKLRTFGEGVFKKVGVHLEDAKTVVEILGRAISEG